MAYGDYQDEIYRDGLRGVVPRFPMTYDVVEVLVTSSLTMSPVVKRRSSSPHQVSWRFAIRVPWRRRQYQLGSPSERCLLPGRRPCGPAAGPHRHAVLRPPGR
jgi:hypothetical protein